MTNAAVIADIIVEKLNLIVNSVSEISWQGREFEFYSGFFTDSNNPALATEFPYCP